LDEGTEKSCMKSFGDAQ